MTTNHITTQDPTKIPLLSKISLVLFGVFVTSLIFALSIKAFEEFGIWIGLLTASALVFCGFYYTSKGARLRIITWSILSTVTAGTILYFIGLIYISSNLEKIL